MSVKDKNKIIFSRIELVHIIMYGCISKGTDAGQYCNILRHIIIVLVDSSIMYLFESSDFPSPLFLHRDEKNSSAHYCLALCTHCV